MEGERWVAGCERSVAPSERSSRLAKLAVQTGFKRWSNSSYRGDVGASTGRRKT